MRSARRGVRRRATAQPHRESRGLSGRRPGPERTAAQLPSAALNTWCTRRFEERYAGGDTFFAEPDALLTAAPVLLGTGGTKMSKSRGNAIELRASEDDIARLIRATKTDTARLITYDPEACPEVAALIFLAALRAVRHRPQRSRRLIGGLATGAGVRLAVCCDYGHSPVGFAGIPAAPVASW
ncbi:MAG: hypothetical protein ACYDH5_02125 [Acidimicrobiales bacterium]